MSDKQKDPVGIYYLVLGSIKVMVLRLDENAESTLCIIYSRVSGRSFLRQSVRDGILRKVDYESFESLWDFYDFPDFHQEDDVIVDGHTAELLCMYLETYAEMANSEYDFREVYELFSADKDTRSFIPFVYKGAGKDYAPKDMSALVVNQVTGTVKCYYDKRDALSLMELHESRDYKKRTRKQVLHSALPYESFESVRTYAGLTGQLIAYLFWMDEEFG